MTSDVLRRAAARLREHRDEIQAFSPWAAEVHEDGRAWVNVPGAQHAWGMHGFPGEAAYVALMHPPVALALAAAMDEVALALELDATLDGRLGYSELIAAARAILREDS